MAIVKLVTSSGNCEISHWKTDSQGDHSYLRSEVPGLVTLWPPGRPAPHSHCKSSAQGRSFLGDSFRTLLREGPSLPFHMGTLGLQVRGRFLGVSLGPAEQV